MFNLGFRELNFFGITGLRRLKALLRHLRLGLLGGLGVGLGALPWNRREVTFYRAWGFGYGVFVFFVKGYGV